MKITKQEVIKIVGKEQKVKRETVKAVVDGIIDFIKKALGKGNTVHFKGFGAFEPRMNKGGWKRNPLTGEKVYKAPSKRPHFRTFDGFKDDVNKP